MFRVQLVVQKHEAAAAELLLSHMNACSITLAEPAHTGLEIYEPPIDTHPVWPELILEAYFEHDINHDELSRGLNRLLSRIVDLHIVHVNENDWQTGFQQQFPPQFIGDQLCILAPWHAPLPQYQTQFIVNPGIAFGTGSHPTTRLCLEWLAEHSPVHKRLLDYGCGSGILGLAAYALGARPVHAVDIDPQALAATRANIVLNQFPLDDFEIAEYVSGSRYDIIIANILYAPLVALRHKFHQLLSTSGILVVSGFLEEQCSQLANAYGDVFQCRQTFTREDWALLEFHPVGNLFT